MNGLLDRADHLRPVGDVQAGRNIRKRVGQGLDDLGSSHAGHACADSRVEDDEVHLVARTVGQGSEKQGGFDRGVEARGASQRDRVDLFVLWGSEQGRRGAPAVHDDHDVAVAFGPPLAHHQFRRTRGRAPVDVARIVAHDVGAQGIELGSRAAQRRRCGSFKLVEAGQARGQQDARLELGEHRQGQGSGQAHLARSQVQGTPRANRDDVGLAGAAPGRGEHRGDALGGARAQSHSLAHRRRIERRGPRVAHIQVHVALRRVCQPQAGLGGLVSANRPGHVTAETQGARGGSGEGIEEAHGHDEATPRPRESARRGEGEGDEPDQYEERATR